MTIDNIIKKIETQTVEEVNKIINNAKSKASEYQQEANKILTSELNQVRTEGNKRITIMRNIHLSEARRIARRTTLSAKEDIIKECFNQASEILKALSGEEYRKVMVQLINDSLPLINNKGSVKLTRKEDQTILSAFPNLTVSSVLVKGLGGLILQSADGKVVVDNTFDAILERKKEKIRAEIANILFADE